MFRVLFRVLFKMLYAPDMDIPAYFVKVKVIKL